MGYSTSIDALERVKGFLSAMANAKEDQLAWKADDPRKVQYFIHCGLDVAVRVKHDLFQHLKKEWKIKAGDGIVIATRKTPSKMLDPTLYFTDCNDLYSVVTKLTTLKDSEVPIAFSNVILNHEDQQKLAKWCDSNGFICKQERASVYVQRY